MIEGVITKLWGTDRGSFMLYPMKLTAPLKDYLWGGTKLKDEYGKVTDKDKVSESWELACHKDGMNIIENGEFAGKTLQEYIDTEGKGVLGENAQKFPYFPILIKLIDAKDNLSVQVHPNDDYAMRVEGEFGKTEMWYIVDCEPDASLIYGFKEKISKEEFAQRIENNTLLEVCNQVPVKKGDVFFIEAGTLHAIGKGILIAEIQQNSNTTYRVYDFGRVGADGKPRELHVEKAKEVTALMPPTRPVKPLARIPLASASDYKMDLLASCELFTVFHVDVAGKCSLNVDKSSFQSFTVLDGSLELSSGDEKITVKKGETVFLPADLGDYELVGNGEIVLSMV